MLAIQSAGLINIPQLRRGSGKRKVNLLNPFHNLDVPYKDDTGRTPSAPETLYLDSKNNTPQTKRTIFKKSKSFTYSEEDLPNIKITSSYEQSAARPTAAPSHSHSDTCIKVRRDPAASSEEHGGSGKLRKPRIEVVGSSSAMVCGTDFKEWFVKVDVTTIVPCGSISVTADGHTVKIKVKVHTKGFLTDKTLSFKRFLRLKGKVLPWSLKTTAEKDGILRVQFYERLTY